MALGSDKVRASLPEINDAIIRLQGAGAAAPTLDEGKGVTITRAGVGDYTITWAENPGRFVTWSWALGATTPADVDDLRLVRGVFNDTANSLQIVLVDNTPTAHELQTAEFVDITVRFSRTSA